MSSVGAGRVDLSTPVTLRVGNAVCEILPGLGGSIARWAICEQEIFRRATPESIERRDPLGMATFPLVPYSNRIGGGRFNWAGQSHHIGLNFPPEPHALHGTGWTGIWACERLSETSVLLRFAQEANCHWPWAFEAEQRILLEADCLSLQLSARNLSGSDAPLAFGHHPYFDSEGATLVFSAAELWTTGADGLPENPTPPAGQFDFATAQPVQGRALDNGYAGWDGKAYVSWADRPLALDIEADMTAAVVYVPEGGKAFCFEPVPHIINALNLPNHGPQMPVVRSGATFQAEVKFTAKPC
jgi:aldose 1-epimerase